ncbi:MAG: prepilin-type N-terminal cleavage/methylation domain-containing protein [Verrucomicrobiae bacterium]|nr:prepilin-type N-terminal cleavage/methylation domain-containing protein [Verrucomicrobiae bacterium]
MSTKGPFSRRAGRRAFTLVEVMVAMGIGVAMMGAVTLASIELYKNFSAGINYRNVHENARTSLAYLSRDIRSASNLVNFASNDITMDVVNSGGGVSRVRYQLVSQNLIRTVTVSGSTLQKQLTDNVTTINFERYTKPGTPATSNANTYEIRVSLVITNSSAFRVASDLLQTRVRLRNM